MKKIDVNFLKDGIDIDLKVITYKYFLSGKTTSLHKHEQYEICLCSGKGDYLINNQRYQYQPGDIFFVKGNDYHQPYSKKEEPSGGIVIYFNPPAIAPAKDTYRWLHYFSLGSIYQLNQIGQCEKSASLITELQKQYDRKDTFSILYCKGLLIQIIAIVCKKIADALQKLKTPNKLKEQTRLHSAIVFIEENLSNKLYAEEIYAKAHMSKAAFCKLFKATYNKSLTQYIRSQRLNSAIKQLVLTDKKILDICYSCGYRTQGLFNQHFRQYTGFTPTEYRTQKHI